MNKNSILFNEIDRLNEKLYKQLDLVKKLDSDIDSVQRSIDRLDDIYFNEGNL